MISFSHKPVMLEECMQGLRLRSGCIYFDGTAGGSSSMARNAAVQVSVKP